MACKTGLELALDLPDRPTIAKRHPNEPAVAVVLQQQRAGSAVGAHHLVVTDPKAQRWCRLQQAAPSFQIFLGLHQGPQLGDGRGQPQAGGDLLSGVAAQPTAEQVGVGRRALEGGDPIGNPQHRVGGPMLDGIE